MSCSHSIYVQAWTWRFVGLEVVVDLPSFIRLQSSNKGNMMQGGQSIIMSDTVIILVPGCSSLLSGTWQTAPHDVVASSLHR